MAGMTPLSGSHSPLLAAGFAAAALLTACGIDQGGARVTPAATTTLVSGPITGFGSIHVNGLTLEIDGTVLRIDGQAAVESDFRRGQIIRAIATRRGSTLTARSIDHEENLVGPVDAIDSAAGTVTVFGTTIVVDAATEVDIANFQSLDDLSLGETIVVSGFVVDDDDLVATYLGRAEPNRAYQLTARITTLDLATLSFDLGPLAVDYSASNQLMLPNGAPEVGLFVEVTGSTIANGQLVASAIRLPSFVPGRLDASAITLTPSELSLTGQAGGTQLDANVVGLVTATSLPGRISLSDVDVEIEASTVIVGGARSGFIVGDRVQVEGRIVTDGQIRATRITLL